VNMEWINPVLIAWIVGCGVSVFFSAVYSGSEIGLYCVNRLRLNVSAVAGDATAIRLRGLLADQPGVLFMALLGTNLSNYLASICFVVVVLAMGATESRAELYATLILTPIILVFGEILPKVLFERQPDRLLHKSARIIEVSYRFAKWTGLVRLQELLARFVLRAFHRQAPSGWALHSRLEMYHLLRESAAEGALSRTQLYMLERVHVLRSIRVGSVMVPLNQVVMLSDTLRVKEAAPLVRSAPFSRFPVYQGARSNLVGLVHVLDVLTADPEAPITQTLLPPVEVRFDTDVIEALEALQKRNRRMAFVVNERGRCLGVVTVKDLVEEIVGELTAW
jgi:putative hemolysin